MHHEKLCPKTLASCICPGCLGTLTLPTLETGSLALLNVQHHTEIFIITLVNQSILQSSYFVPVDFMGSIHGVCMCKQVPVVQSIVSLTSSLRGKLIMFYDFITKYTDIFC